MKALAIDSAITQLTIAAKNEDHTVSCVYNIGMKQSETLLPSIEYTLKKVGLEVKDIDYLALCSGPGSFTGLRLGYAALKAIELTTNKPLFGISTLDCYSEPYKDLPFVVVPCIDAKKDRFYIKAFFKGEELVPEGDYEIDTIIQKLNLNKDLLFVGPDATLLKDLLKDKLSSSIYTVPFSNTVTESLFRISEDKLSKGEKPLDDYDGPVYLRASEAEIKLNQ